MITLFWLVFGMGLVLLTVAAGVTLGVRRREQFGRVTPRVDDDVLEQILTLGEVDVDEPLDLEEIEEEEERFWSESWDEPSGEWGGP